MTPLMQNERSRGYRLERPLSAQNWLLGRVLANVYGGVGVAAAAGYLLGGPVLDATSPRTAFVIVGCGGLAGAAVTAVLLRRGGGSPAGSRAGAAGPGS